MAKLTWRKALHWRMGRHGLLERGGGDPLETTARICGLHAQVMSSAELTLWARHDDLPRDLVSGALWDDRTLVKLWAARGTLHLLPTTELSLWLGALGTYEHYLKPVWLRAFEIERHELERLMAAIGKALEGKPLTREELGAAVERSDPGAGHAERVSGSSGPFLKPASFRGLLCFGPGEGRNVWVIGASRDHPSQLEPEHKGRVHRPQGWISPVLLVNGSIQGVRSHERRGDRLLVEVEPFGRRPAWVRKQVAAEAERLAGFLGGELELAWK